MPSSRYVHFGSMAKESPLRLGRYDQGPNAAFTEETSAWCKSYLFRLNALLIPSQGQTPRVFQDRQRDRQKGDAIGLVQRLGRGCDRHCPKDGYQVHIIRMV